MSGEARVVKDKTVWTLNALKEYLERIAEFTESAENCDMSGEEPLCSDLCNNSGCLHWHIRWAEEALAAAESKP